MTNGDLSHTSQGQTIPTQDPDIYMRPCTYRQRCISKTCRHTSELYGSTRLGSQPPAVAAHHTETKHGIEFLQMQTQENVTLTAPHRKDNHQHSHLTERAVQIESSVKITRIHADVWAYQRMGSE
jgi:hypothetical protein